MVLPFPRGLNSPIVLNDFGEGRGFFIGRFFMGYRDAPLLIAIKLKRFKLDDDLVGDIADAELIVASISQNLFFQVDYLKKATLKVLDDHSQKNI